MSGASSQVRSSRLLDPTHGVELLGLRAFEARVARSRWRRRRRLAKTRGDGDRHRGANGKDAARLSRGQVVALEIQDPHGVERGSQQLPEADEARSSQKRGRREKAHDARSTPLLADRPHRPAPEVDVIIEDALQMQPRVVFPRRARPRRLTVADVPSPRIAEAHPAALAGPCVTPRNHLALIRRIPQAHHEVAADLQWPFENVERPVPGRPPRPITASRRTVATAAAARCHSTPASVHSSQRLRGR